MLGGDCKLGVGGCWGVLLGGNCELCVRSGRKVLLLLKLPG